jgi:hypothetical protein
LIFLPEAWPYSLDIPGAFRAIRCILHVQMATLESCIGSGLPMGRTNIRATRVSKWRLGARTRHPPTLVMIETSVLAVSSPLHPALTLRAPTYPLRDLPAQPVRSANQHPSHAREQVATGRSNPTSPDASHDRNIGPSGVIAPPPNANAEGSDVSASRSSRPTCSLREPTSEPRV